MEDVLPVVVPYGPIKNLGYKEVGRGPHAITNIAMLSTDE